MMILNRSKWLSLLVVLAVLALGGYYAFSSAQPADADNEELVLEFDVAEDMTRFVFQEAPVHENGMPAHGNPFITSGYIYPKGTLDGTNGVLEDGSPEFPDKVIGSWICRGWFYGDGAAATSGPMVITTQIYNFGEEYGNLTLVSEGYELADVGVPVKRAITGGTGDYSQVRGEASQTFLGFNEGTEGVDLTFTIELQQPADVDASGS
jgi:hypothetical protein